MASQTPFVDRLSELMSGLGFVAVWVVAVNASHPTGIVLAGDKLVILVVLALGGAFFELEALCKILAWGKIDRESILARGVGADGVTLTADHRLLFGVQFLKIHDIIGFHAIGMLLTRPMTALTADSHLSPSLFNRFEIRGMTAHTLGDTVFTGIRGRSPAFAFSHPFARQHLEVLVQIILIRLRRA